MPHFRVTGSHSTEIGPVKTRGMSQICQITKLPKCQLAKTGQGHGPRLSGLMRRRDTHIGTLEAWQNQPRTLGPLLKQANWGV
jgi:hypothetical protein